ncbi:MAG: hypothetical protein OHK0012_23640 [Synechococcales cyanobacterium]
MTTHSLRIHDVLKPFRRWLDDISVSSTAQAHQLCRWIPAQCPFERDIVCFGHVVGHIPPLCQINPLYEELMGLRFRALTYLADRGEDIKPYISTNHTTQNP